MGAIPSQVYIDGIAQLENPVVSPKPPSFQDVPQTPSFDAEAIEAVQYEGLPPLLPKKRPEAGASSGILFVNVSALWTIKDLNITPHPNFKTFNETANIGSVFVRKGKITCVSSDIGDLPLVSSCVPPGAAQVDYLVINLDGGMITPALTTFGTEVGVSEIRLESSTNDGNVIDPLAKPSLPSILGDIPVVRAADGLSFQGRNAL